MTDQTENGTDAEILFPDVAVTLSTGEQVTVREFRYLEGLRAVALARPLLDRLRELGATAATQTVIETLLLEHWETWAELLCLACDRDQRWLSQLADQDGMTLTMAFWRANSSFFMRRLVLHSGADRALQAVLATLYPSPSCSTSSSAPATAETRERSPIV